MTVHPIKPAKKPVMIMPDKPRIIRVQATRSSGAPAYRDAPERTRAALPMQTWLDRNAPDERPSWWRRVGQFFGRG